MRFNPVGRFAERLCDNCLATAAIALTVAALTTAAAQEIETSAKQAYLVDIETGAVLYEKNAYEHMPPSSMTKMMTTYILFSRLADGTLSLTDTFTVSERAWRKGGSKMFVEVGTQVTVEDLLRGIIVQSGNDATIVVAEGLAGSEDAFAREMNETAARIGMTDTYFTNASGWPDPDHHTTAADLATLAIRTIEDFPELYHLYAETEFTYHDIRQQNRNPLLYRNIGADGLKTGHTQDAGYGLTASAVRDGRRLVLVVNGMPSARDRANESERLLAWGFREWGSYRLFGAGETVGEIPVWLGDRPTVSAIVREEMSLTMRRRDRADMQVKLRYEEPVPAPIRPGQVLGEIVVETPGRDPVIAPLIAAGGVEQLGPLGRLGSAIRHLVWGEGR